MFEITSINNMNTGLEVIDTAVKTAVQIVRDIGSKSFEFAHYLYTCSESPAFKAQMGKLSDSEGKPYDNFVKWVMDTFNMGKSQAYDLVLTGKHTVRIDNGKPHGQGYASKFAYTALRDSKAKRKYDEDTGALLTIDYSNYDYYAPDFQISAAGVLAHYDYDDVVKWIAQGYIRPDMSVRELKENCKSLKKGVTIEDSKGEDSKGEDSKGEDSKGEDSKPEMVTFAIDGIAYSIPKDVLEKYKLK